MRRSHSVCAALVAGAALLACGDVPTAGDGIAYVSTILTPAPAIAIGDSLRDSTGAVTPLRVVAYDANGAVVSNAPVKWILTSPLTGNVVLDSLGHLRADTIAQTLRIVAQVAGRLQTPEFTIDAVPPADSIAPSAGTTDTITLPAQRAISVTVTGRTPAGIRTNVKGIIVRYRITSPLPGPAGDPRIFYFLADNNTPLRPDSTIAVDTTDASGVASRSLVALHSLSGAPDPREVHVEVRARSLRGVELAGSPLTVVLKVNTP